MEQEVEEQPLDVAVDREREPLQRPEPVRDPGPNTAPDLRAERDGGDVQILRAALGGLAEDLAERLADEAAELLVVVEGLLRWARAATTPPWPAFSLSQSPRG